MLDYFITLIEVVNLLQKTGAAANFENKRWTELQSEVVSENRISILLCKTNVFLSSEATCTALLIAFTCIHGNAIVHNKHGIEEM